MRFLLFYILLLSASLILRRSSPGMGAGKYYYASFTHRLLADLWDVLFALGIVFPFWLIFDIWLHHLSFEAAVGDRHTLGIARIALVVVGFYNLTYLVGKTGQSWGRKRRHIKVIDYAGNPIGFWRALLRNALAGSISSIFFLGFLWIMWDERRQAWHDKLMKTFVVYDEERGQILEQQTTEEYYHVAKIQAAGFIGQLTLEEISRQFHAGELPGDYVATRSLGRSYHLLIRSGTAAWVTVAALVATPPPQNPTSS